MEITPSGTRTLKVVFNRDQLVGAQAVKTDKAGNFLSIDTSRYEPPGRKGKKHNTGSYKGPDEDGSYRSYGIKFKASSGNKETEDGDAAKDSENAPVPDGDFKPVMKYLNRLEDEQEETYMLYMRKFGISQSRTRIRSTISKLESYIKKRRQKVVIKESATLPWQGIVFLIFGLLGLMLTLLIGQFWDEPPRKTGGPGARRVNPTTKGSTKEQPKFFVDTGRPSKYPPGYKKY